MGSLVIVVGLDGELDVVRFWIKDGETKDVSMDVAPENWGSHVVGKVVVGVRAERDVA